MCVADVVVSTRQRLVWIMNSCLLRQEQTAIFTQAFKLQYLPIRRR